MAAKKEVKPDTKMHTFTVMHSAGEVISGVKYVAHEEFKSLLTDDLREKVAKGFLVLNK